MTSNVVPTPLGLIHHLWECNTASDVEVLVYRTTVIFVLVRSGYEILDYATSALDSFSEELPTFSFTTLK